MLLTSTNLPSLLLLGAAVVCLLAGGRAIQLGRQTTSFRHRRDRVLAGWWLIGFAILFFVIGFGVYRPGESFLPASSAATAGSPAASPTETSTQTPTPRTAAQTSTPVRGGFTATTVPAMPLSIEAMAISTVTPAGGATLTDIKFSTEMEGQLAQNPSANWRNPIKQMYAAFAYRGMTPGAQWTVLWLRDGNIVYVESHPWNGAKEGRGFALWIPDPPYNFLPGAYEVQFFMGNQWIASGRFTLTGDPVKPTPTLTPRPTRIPSQTPLPTRTPPDTSTPTPVPSSTLTPTSTFSPTPRPTRTFTSTPTSTWTPSSTFTPSRTPTLIYTALPTSTSLYQKVTVYFIDTQRLASGLIPPEVGVTRYGSSTSDPLKIVLDAYFIGPGESEKRSDLVSFLNGFTGYAKLVRENGVLRVYLTGACEQSLTGYSIAQALIVNLKQFPDVQYVKIYDQNGQTRDPSGANDSAPACLGFSSLLYPTRTPTAAPNP